MIELIDPLLLLPEEIDSRYMNSPFRHIKLMGPKQKGKRYENIAESVLTKIGFSVIKAENTEHDRIINGIKTEIKGSTLNKDCDNFSFLQIRPDQDYKQMFFVMCYPNELVIMKMSKKTIQKNIDSGIFKKQHGGNKAESRTFMYYGNKESLSQIGALLV
jgi:hypothetical protein